MCIIAIYDIKNGGKIDRDILEVMIERNPDGVGVAYNTGREVVFKKGLQDADEVLAYIDRHRAKMHYCVFHARIATSGGVSAEKCHPYPLTADLRQLNATHGTTRGAVCFHNGMLSVNIEQGLNDTQSFIKNDLARLNAIDGRGVKSGKYDELIKLATRGSRFVIMYPEGLKCYGEWETEDGVLYSNTTYKRPRYTYHSNLYDYGDYGAGWGRASSYIPAKYRLNDINGGRK